MTKAEIKDFILGYTIPLITGEHKVVHQQMIHRLLENQDIHYSVDVIEEIMIEMASELPDKLKIGTYGGMELISPVTLFIEEGGFKEKARREQEEKDLSKQNILLTIQTLQQQVEQYESSKHQMSLSIEQMQRQIGEMKRNKVWYTINWIFTITTIGIAAYTLYLELWKEHLNPF
jgi:hypothetical protein